MNIFESLENLEVSEACFDEIIGLVEELLDESKYTISQRIADKYIKKALKENPEEPSKTKAAEEGKDKLRNWQYKYQDTSKGASLPKSSDKHDKYAQFKRPLDGNTIEKALSKHEVKNKLSKLYGPNYSKEQKEFLKKLK